MYRKHRGETSRAFVAVAWLAFGAAGCGATGDGLISLPCTEKDGNCVSMGDRDGASIDSSGTPRLDGADLFDSGPSRSPLCGTYGCYPGNPSACGATMATDAAGPSALDTDASDAAGDTTLDEPPSHPSNDASASPALDVSSEPTEGAAEASADVSLENSSPSDGQADAGATDEPKTPQSCYVKPSSAGVVTECSVVGPGAPGDPCQDSTQCGALLACVDVNETPVCRPFSCALPEECPPGSFYQQVPLRVAGITLPGVMVPVCLPNDHPCELLATPSPCAGGKVCAVVGSGGETTCVLPGSAKLGDPCDDLSKLCAEGLICSVLKNECLQICHVGAGMTECPGGTCQGGSLQLPSGFGICVGGNPDGG